MTEDADYHLHDIKAISPVSLPNIREGYRRNSLDVMKVVFIKIVLLYRKDKYQRMHQNIFKC